MTASRIEAAATVTIGLISDTHGLLRPEALAALAGSRHIIHAGDIGDPAILAALSEIAPTSAVRGNIDTAGWARALPLRSTLRFGAIAIHVLHDLAEFDPACASGCQAVIAGHSHRAAIREQDGMLFVNPGSAGRRRFRLPVCLGRILITEGKLRPEIITLQD